MSDENVGGLVELLPCPGCGGNRTRVIGGPGTKGGPKFWAGCDLCRWRTWGNTEADAILSWNTRLSAHGQPVVDGRMARGWRNRFISAQTELNQRANGNDYELARAYAEATANEYEEALIAAIGGNDHG